MTALFKNIPHLKNKLKTCFFLYSNIPGYESVFSMSPQVLIVDLCADKFLQEVSEITVPVTHGFMPGKGIDERK